MHALTIFSVALIVWFPASRDLRSLSERGLGGVGFPQGNSDVLMALVLSRAKDHDVQGVANITPNISPRRIARRMPFKLAGLATSY